MSDLTLSLKEIFEPAPFIDIALGDDEADLRKKHQLEPLSLGAGYGFQPERLHPALLRAHVALARLLEASGTLDIQEPPLKFLLLSEAHANLRHAGLDIDLEKVLAGNENQNSESERIGSLLQSIPGLSQRTSEQGFNRQRLIEIASAIGCTEPVISRNTDTSNAARGRTVEPLNENQFAALLENWHEFTELSHRNLDTLIVSAVAFARFCQLSPLSTNNTVAAHLIWQLLLIDADLCKFPVLSLSELISKSGDEYERRLTLATVQNDTQAQEEWVLYCIEIIEQAALMSLSRVHKCRYLFESMHHTVTSTVAGQHGESLYKLLCQFPIIKIKHVVDADIAKRQTASIYLSKLVDCGLLESRQSGRSKSFFNQEYLQIFDWDSPRSN